MIGLFSKRSAGIGAILAAAASSLFGGGDRGGTSSFGGPIMGLRMRGASDPQDHGHRAPSYTKRGPGRYARLGLGRLPSRSWFFGWGCRADRVRLYLHAAARRRLDADLARNGRPVGEGPRLMHLDGYFSGGRSYGA